MAGRPNWKGYLKLSLVSCPVAMFNATTKRDKVAFHLLNRDTHNRLRRQLIDPDTGTVVDNADQVHGYEVSKGDYLIVEDEEIDSLAIESSHVIDVDLFVKREDVDDVYLDTPYYLVPDGKMGEEAFAVIREAMGRRQMAGVARIVMARREHVVLLQPHERGIVATTLRFPYEIKASTEILSGISNVEIGDEMLDLAEHIIDKKTGPFEPEAFVDRYEQALLDLLKSKKAGKPVKASKAVAEPSNVVDLMEALRRSVGEAPKTAGAKAKPAAASHAVKKPAAKAAKPPRRKAG